MHIMDRGEVRRENSTWKENFECILKVLAPTKPQLAHRSLLQRIGESLWHPQAGANSALLALDADLDFGMEMQGYGFPPSTPQSSPQLQSGKGRRVCDDPNYSYGLIPSGNVFPTRVDPIGEWDRCYDRRIEDAMDKYHVSSPTTYAQMQAPQHDGYFGDISLLSALSSSNPRTRAPFKPQKGGRGTSSWQLKQYAEATLGSGSLRKAVKLPEGEDKDEWLAVNGEDYSIEVLEVC